MYKLFEMSKDDVTVKKILQHYEDGDQKCKEEVSSVITGKPTSTLQVIEKELEEMDYREIKQMEKEIFKDAKPIYELHEDGTLFPFTLEEDMQENSVLVTSEDLKAIYETKKKKPSTGLSKVQKSNVVKSAEKGEDIGKKGKGFEKVADKATKEYGSKEAGEKVAAVAMWKNIKR